MPISLCKVISKNSVRVIADVDGVGMLMLPDFENRCDTISIKDIPEWLKIGDYAFWDCRRDRFRYCIDKSPPIIIESGDDISNIEELIKILGDGIYEVVLDNCPRIFHVGKRIKSNGRGAVFCPREMLRNGADGSVRLVENIRGLNLFNIRIEDVFTDVDGVRFWKNTFRLPTVARSNPTPHPDTPAAPEIIILRNEFDCVQRQINDLQKDNISTHQKIDELIHSPQNPNNLVERIADIENDIRRSQFEIENRISFLETSIARLSKVVTSRLTGFVAGTTPLSLQTISTYDYSDVIKCAAENLNGIGCPLNLSTKLLATVMFAANTSCQPLLIIGRKAKEAVNALSVALYCKTAGYMKCSPGLAHDSLDELSIEDKVIVFDEFAPEHAVKIINSLGKSKGKLLCFTCARKTSGFCEGFLQICMPIFIDDFIDDDIEPDCGMRFVDYKGNLVQYIPDNNQQFNDMFRKLFPNVSTEIVSALVPYACVLATRELIDRDKGNDVIAIFGLAQYAISLQRPNVIFDIIDLVQVTPSTRNWLLKTAKRIKDASYQTSW